jgi:hypothetical protein
MAQDKCILSKCVGGAVVCILGPGLRISSLDFEQFEVRIDESEAGKATHPCRDPCCIFKGLRTVGISIFRWVNHAWILRPEILSFDDTPYSSHDCRRESRT